MLKSAHRLISRYLRSIVYGGTDGIITVFAIVAGVSGGSLSPTVILILGLSTLLADALSMSVSDYVSSSADDEFQAMEKQVISTQSPEKLQVLLKRVFSDRGYQTEHQDALVQMLAEDKRTMIDIILMHQEDTTAEQTRPFVSAIFTFTAFTLFGLLPLLSELFLNSFLGIETNSVLVATVLTGIALFVLGFGKALMVNKSGFSGGIQLVCVGGLASFIAYLVAYYVATLTDTEKVIPGQTSPTVAR